MAQTDQRTMETIKKGLLTACNELHFLDVMFDAHSNDGIEMDGEHVDGLKSILKQMQGRVSAAYCYLNDSDFRDAGE